MKLFITGATGYIGNQLALTAAGNGFRIHALVRNPQSPFIPNHPNIKLFKGDITDKSSVEIAMSGCDAVIHTAAFTKENDEHNPEFYEVNVTGTRNVLETALFHNVSRFVFTASNSVYGPSANQPISESEKDNIVLATTYARTKYQAEELVKEFSKKGLWVVMVSPTRIYGPGNLTTGNPITRLIYNALKRKIAFMPSGGQSIGNYVYIDDVVKGHFLAMENGMNGEKYIIGGENISYKQFFNSIKKASGENICIIRVPKQLVKSWTIISGAIFKLTGSCPKLSHKLIDRIWQNRALSSEKSIKQIGYTITPIAVGMAKTIDHIKKKNQQQNYNHLNLLL